MDYIVSSNDLTSVADAIRTKGGTSEALEWPNGYIDAINAISGSGGGTAHTVTRTDSMTYVFDYDLGELVAANIQIVTGDRVIVNVAAVYSGVTYTYNNTTYDATVFFSAASAGKMAVFTMPDADVTVSPKTGSHPKDK